VDENVLCVSCRDLSKGLFRCDESYLSHHTDRVLSLLLCVNLTSPSLSRPAVLSLLADRSHQFKAQAKREAASGLFNQIAAIFKVPLSKPYLGPYLS
jgi:hypothetical protein